jgi:hypothetical protein
MLEYNGYKTDGDPSRCNGRGIIIEVARVEGKIFQTMNETEQYGLELARRWVDRKCLGR